MKAGVFKFSAINYVMEQPETKRLSEAVEAGLRDGRTLDSLRKAMQDSGYGEEEIKGTLGGVDRRRISRKPPRRRLPTNWIAAAIVVIILISAGSYVFLGGKAPQQVTPSGNNTTKVLRICYVLNESIKQREIMEGRGTNCDEWYLIKEI